MTTQEIFRTEIKFDDVKVAAVVFKNYENYENYVVIQEDDYLDGEGVGETPIGFYKSSEEAINFAKSFIDEIKAT